MRAEQSPNTPSKLVAALLKPPSLAGGEAGSREPIFLSGSYTLNGRSQPGTADLAQITYSFSSVSGQTISARRRLPVCGMFTSKPLDLAMLLHACVI